MKNTTNTKGVLAKQSKADIFKSLQNFLTGDLSGIAQNLIDRVKYTVDHPVSKVAKTDLEELALEVHEAITTAVQSLKKSKQPVEASLKKKTPGAKTSAPKKTTKVEEETEETDEEETPKEAPKTSKGSKKSSLKQGVKTTAKQLTAKSSLPTATLFPETIEDEELGTLVRADDKFHSYKELVEFLEGETPVYFACYWTSRHIKEYQYSDNFSVACPKSFPNDLDILVALLNCERVDRVWAMSRYTEAMFRFEGEDFEPVEDKDPNTGDTYTVRVCKGMEFELYLPTEQ